jgi:hypothetical protein
VTTPADELGARTRTTGSVEDAHVFVELPDQFADDATLEVVAERLDDEPGSVDVVLRGSASVRVTLGTDEARQLATSIIVAADAADQDV